MGQQIENLNDSITFVGTIQQNKVVKSLIILMIILYIGPVVASAVTADIYVNQTGWWHEDDTFNALNPLQIQAAIDAADIGDTIYVYNGSYTENVNVNKAVTLQGEGADVVNVTATNDHVFNVSADDVNISGFNVTGATGTGKAGIYLSSNHSNISDNNASNNSLGIYLKSSSNNTLTSNNANSNTGYGIYLEESSNNTLMSNNANSNHYAGIDLYSSSNNNTLTSNNANSNTDYGIFLQSSSNNNTLTNNNASNNSMYGIRLESSSNNTIYNNYLNNTNNAGDNGYNVWNTTKTAGTNIINGSYLGGNYWSDYAGADTDGDGLGDTLTPYNSSGNIANGGDYHPLYVDTSAPVVTASKTYSNYSQINQMTIDSDITVTDGDSNITGATVSIGDGYVSSEDYLNYTTINSITGSYNTTTGILTLTGNRSGSDYQAAFRNVSYWNSNTNNPNTSQRNITFAIGNNSLYYPGTGHYYEFVSPTLNWGDANSSANTRTFYGLQGYLATINSSEENTFIHEKVSGDAWIGASDSAIEGDWKWVTGPEAGTLFYRGNWSSNISFGYTNWNNHQPDDWTEVSVPGEDFLEMYSTGGGTWNDLPDTESLNYLVEYGGMAGDPTLHLTAMVIVNVTDIMPPIAPTITVPANGANLTLSYTWVNGTTDVTTSNVTVYVNGTITNNSVAVSSNQFNISNVPLGADGDYEINVSAKDAAGNVNTTNATAIVTVDTIRPVVTFVSLTPDNNSNLSVNYIRTNVTVDDTHFKNVTTYVYYSNGTEKQNITNTSSPALNNFTDLQDGTYIINATAYDWSNNSNTTESRNITIDTTRPIVTFVSPTPANNSNLSQTYIQTNVTVNDANFRNVTTYIYYANGTEKQNITNSSYPAVDNFTDLSDGTYIINATAYDWMNNSNITGSRNITLDTIPPNVPTIDVPANGDGITLRYTWVNGTTSTDTTNVSVYVNGTKTNDSVAVSNNSFNISNVPFVADGLFEINVSSIDVAGNVNPENATVSVYVASPVTSTTTYGDADFDQGVLNGLNHETGPLQVNSTATSFSIMWIANAGEDTISKIDTNTGNETARYRSWFGSGTHGAWSGPAPSRSAVDRDGNAYIANRHFDGKPASIVKILADGGIDRNSNGVIDTSVDSNGNGVIDPAELLPMTDTNSNGIVDPDEITDERIEWIVQVGPSNGLGRSLAIDPNGNLWLGLYNSKTYYKVSSVNGSILAGPIDVSPNTPYGAMVDRNGTLWGSSLGSYLLKLDTNTNTKVGVYTHPGSDYGIAIGNDKVYLACSSGCSYIMYDPATNTFTTPASLQVTALGIAVDANGNILIGKSSGGVAKFYPDGTLIWNAGQPSGTTETRGVVVDSNNDAWGVHLNQNSISKFNGSTGALINTYPVGLYPYTYSDATGSGLRSSSNLTGTWIVINDSNYTGAIWNKVTWDEVIPSGASIEVKVRSADTEAGLPLVTYQSVINDADISTNGRFIQVFVRLTANSTGGSPTFSNLTLYRQSVANVPPPAPGNFTSPANGQFIIGKQTIDVSWGASIDPYGDTVVYNLDYFNNSSWTRIGTHLPGTSMRYYLPDDNTSNAKFRVYATDLFFTSSASEVTFVVAPYILKDLSYTEQQGWKKLDTDTFSSFTNNFSNGYVEVNISDANSYDELRVLSNGSLNVSGNAVNWSDDSIGTINDTYNGSNGTLRIDFNAYSSGHIVANNTIVKAIVDSMEYNNTADAPRASRSYAANFMQNSGEIFYSAAWLNITAVNDIPTTPGDFTTPTDGQLINGTQPTNVSWGPSTDPDGDAVWYDLWYNNGNGTWTKIGWNEFYGYLLPNPYLIYNLPQYNSSNATFRVYANDTVNISSPRTVTFPVDTLPPVITINSPSNGSRINNNTLQLNTTFGNETVGYAWYSVNNTGNSTPVSNTNNLAIDLSYLPEGTHNVTVYANDTLGNLNSSIVYFTIDTTPPASITNLTASAYSQTYINWTWTDPADSDFQNVSVYLNGIFQINITNGTQYYYATGLTPSTGYTISARTVDTSGNTNTTWVNHTQTTSSPLPVLTTITVYPPSATVASGASKAFTATAKDQYGDIMGVTFVWNSNNTTVGTVGYTGVFIGKKVGNTTIKATSGSVSGSSTVTVVAGSPANMSILPGIAAIKVSQTQLFTAAGIDANGNEVSVTPVWNSSNISVGTINETSGIFMALTSGTASITATDGNISANATVIVLASTPPSSAGGPVITGFSPYFPVSDITGSSRTFSLTFNQTVNVTWYVNGTQVNTNTSVTEANYTNTNAISGTWNVTAIAGNANGTVSYEWIWIVTIPSTGAPVITVFSPSSPISDITGSSRSFSLTFNQTVNVTWYVNGTQVNTNTSVTEANYTNTNAISGTWNLTAIAGNANGTVSHEWIWIVTTTSTGAPVITVFSPSSPVSDIDGSSRTFSLTADQTVNITWYINGTLVFSQTGVTTSSYTNTSAEQGTWNVTAIAGNTNGTVSHEWIWIVGTVVTEVKPPFITISVPVNNTNISIFDGIISGSITDDSDITANMYINSVFNNTWTSNGSFRWQYNFTKNDYNTIRISAVDAYGNYNESIIRFFVLPPVSETLVNLTTNETVSITVNTSTGVDVELSTGNHTANVSLIINASTNASDFNATDIDTEFVSLGIAKKSLIKFIEINATGDVANLSSVRLTVFYKDSDLDLNWDEIIDAGDQKEDTLNLYWYWDNATGEQEWFPLILGADYSDKFDRANNPGPVVISVEKNTILNYISVTMNHFTTFSIAGELIPATTTTNTTTTRNNGSSGYIGSSIITAEPLENIAYSEMIVRYLEAGKPVTYTFSKNQDVVYEVSVIGKETENNVAMRIELLKDISKQVNEAASGYVYRNVNIILGTDKTGESVIKFKVNDSWLIENDLNSSDIRLVEWVDNKWITLETGLLFNKDGYTHFSAKSQTFSIYAITGVKNEEIIPAPLATEKTAITQEAMPLKTEVPAPQTERKPLFWFWMILAVLLVAALAYAMKKR